MKKSIVAFVLVVAAVRAQPPAAPVVQFLFTSDAHYGITRARFRGRTNVDAHIVNAAMVRSMNDLGRARLPADGGVHADEPVGPIDFVVETGDVANREEARGGLGGRPIQPARESWSQFVADYVDGLTTRDAEGRKSALFVTPGNHDASNAVGFWQLMTPATDGAAMAGIYNLMMRPDVPRTPSSYRYDRDPVLTSRDLGGLHLVFMNVWPDSQGRAWLETDLAAVPRNTPVLLFTHDQPDAEAKHFGNPNGAHDVNALDRFEDLLSDRFADGPTIDRESIVEQRALAEFLSKHLNIEGYFHGNSNWTEFYDWHGPDRTITVHTFRVDSPIKGKLSARDETRLAYELATVDMSARTMTVRECLWNADPANPFEPVHWGLSRTIALGTLTSTANQ